MGGQGAPVLVAQWIECNPAKVEVTSSNLVKDVFLCYNLYMLEVIYGPMFSGKSEELIRRLVRAKIGGKRILAIKPEMDIRYGTTGEIHSHGGASFDCETVLEIRDIYPPNVYQFEIIAVDEAQFFDKQQLIDHVDVWRTQFDVIVAGLNLDFRREPFGGMVDVIMVADKVTKLTSVCHVCKNDNAIFTQRLINGEPAPFDSPVIQVGGLEAYEARCYKCYQSG